MKRNKLFPLLLGTLLLLSACSRETSSKDMMSGGSSSSSGPSLPQEEFTESWDSTPELDYENLSAQDLLPAKLVYTGTLSLETTKFDQTMGDLAELLAQYQGYFSNRSVDQFGGYRFGYFTLRVPAEDYQAVLEAVESMAHATHSSTTVEDISMDYYDTQGRLDTQKRKLERLQDLLLEAETMEDIITLETALSDTQWLIDTLSATMNRYDSLVDYATLEVTLREVYQLSHIEEVPSSFWQRLTTGFSNSAGNFAQEVENILVNLSYYWVYVVFYVVVGFLGWKLGKRLLRKFRRRPKKIKEETKQ